MPHRILLLLTQFPFDRVSGATHSDRTACTFLAARGFEVRALATTAGEGRGTPDARAELAARGIVWNESRAASRQAPLLSFSHRGVHYDLLDTPTHEPPDWGEALRGRFEDLLLDTLARFRPEATLTWGGMPMHRRWRKLARRSGSAIVFAQHNLNYVDAGGFHDVDAVLACSAFSAEYYRSRIGLESTVLPVPLDPAEVLAQERDPRCVTQIDVAPVKGLPFSARLFEELCRRRPDIPVLAVDAGRAGDGLVATGLRGGFDLARHRNLEIAGPVSDVRGIYARTRVLLVPSLWQEPAGRVAAEAVVNGIPPILSDRGGLAEMAAPGGIVLPIPPHIAPETAVPPPAAAVGPWLEAIERLYDDDEWYARQAAMTRDAAARYRAESIADGLCAFFSGARRAAGETRGPGIAAAAASPEPPALETMRLLAVIGSFPLADDPGADWLRALLGTLTPWCFDVRVVACTASHEARLGDAREFLERRGHAFEQRLDRALDRPTLAFAHYGIPHVVLDVGNAGLLSWQERDDEPFTQLVESELSRFAPHAVLTTGSSPRHARRRARLRSAGVPVVHAITDRTYLAAGLAGTADRFIVPDAGLAALAAHAGLDARVVPVTWIPEDASGAAAIRALIDGLGGRSHGSP